MKIIAVDYLDKPNMFTVYFSAPHRVDFRGLVRDLTDEAARAGRAAADRPAGRGRLQGGIGPCGRDLCCATFLKDFEPVSVRMAKDQDLPVNPLRIAGACGRLMCCLKYEHPLYQDFHASAPRSGASRSKPRTARASSSATTSRPTGDRQASRGRPPYVLPEGQRLRLPEGLRGDARQCARNRRGTGRLLWLARFRPGVRRLSSVGRAIHS